jgi:hypothetical protein
MSTPPVSFQTLAQTAGNPAAGGYPYQLKASDLDKNFVFATLDVEEGLVETTSGSGGHQQRRLRIPAPGDSSAKQNLSATSNQLDWTPAVPDGVAEGQSMTWDADQERWRLFPYDLKTAKRGSFPQWTQEGWKALGNAGTQKGHILMWDEVENFWKPFDAPPITGTHVLGAVDGALQWIATEEC